MVTAAPLDALDLPVAAMELIAWLRAESLAIEAALLLEEFLWEITVPITAFVRWVPLALFPEVLT